MQLKKREVGQIYQEKNGAESGQTERHRNEERRMLEKSDRIQYLFPDES